MSGIEPDEMIASKLVFSSENAVKGELLVYFGENAVSNVETSVMQVTRSGGIATRSGIVDFDTVLDNIGVRALSRLFPVDKDNEDRTRAAGLHRWYIVEFADDIDLDEAARNMAKIAEVSKVEFNQQLMHVHDGKITPLAETTVATQTRAAVNFDDPMLSKQWHYINTGDPAVYSKAKEGADVNCADAWRLCTGDPRVIVAVVDNCVQWDHPDLAANMWVNPRSDGSSGYVGDTHGYNFLDDTPLTISTGGDSPSHGTHVAGTVAAVNNNGIGGCGVAGGSGKNDGVKIMSCQIFRDGNGGSAAVTAKAIKYAADNGAAIIQCSYGYKANSTNPITSDTQYANSASAEKQAVDYFISKQNCAAIKGGLAIFAAGNEMTSRSSYPAGYRDYISVTSISCDYTPAYYTNYGPGCNIAAPGGDIYQSYLENLQSPSIVQTSSVLSTINGGGYGYSQGTSMACPHVSGVAALGLSYALQLGKSFTQSEFTTILLTSVNNINPYCTGTKQYVNDEGRISTLNLSPYSKQMGTGYIDAYQVLMNVHGITCLPIPVGSQHTLNLQPYLGSGNLDMKITGVEIAAQDMTRLGISSAPTIFANQIMIKCTKPGSAIIKIKLLAGNSNETGMNGMSITKEFALIARQNHSANGGWL
jgi:subtilisin-like serine proteases